MMRQIYWWFEATSSLPIDLIVQLSANNGFVAFCDALKSAVRTEDDFTPQQAEGARLPHNLRSGLERTKTGLVP